MGEQGLACAAAPGTELHGEPPGVERWPAVQQDTPARCRVAVPAARASSCRCLGGRCGELGRGSLVSGRLAGAGEAVAASHTRVAWR